MLVFVVVVVLNAVKIMYHGLLGNTLLQHAILCFTCIAIIVLRGEMYLRAISLFVDRTVFSYNS